jgi:hypothetical protein
MSPSISNWVVAFSNQLPGTAGLSNSFLRVKTIKTMNRDNEEEAEMKLSSGIAAFEAKQFAQALRLLSPLAETGSADAQYRLAIMYQNGLGLVRNELLAYKWMQSAAQQDYGPALHGLGFMYMDGDCAAQDDVRALQWFEAAAKQGLAGAMVALAQMLEQGRGTAPDPKRAKTLYKQAGF